MGSSSFSSSVASALMSFRILMVVGWSLQVCNVEDVLVGNRRLIGMDYFTILRKNVSCCFAVEVLVSSSHSG